MAGSVPKIGTIPSYKTEVLYYSSKKEALSHKLTRNRIQINPLELKRLFVVYLSIPSYLATNTDGYEALES
jgi:hypothetical protein